ncbi:MAG: hypothetical protein IE927_12530 [Rhodobacterales bacterium]|nr:hypothetical protein [Rhodobacterales bacterium]
MRAPPHLAAALRRFLRDEIGAILHEGVLIMPLMAWTWVSLFIYWDAYRLQTTAMKASYTVADIVSRQIVTLDRAYITGLHEVFDYLLADSAPTTLRVSSITFDADDNRYEVLWSYSPTGQTALTTADLALMTARLPIIPDDDTLIVVETSAHYDPVLDVGITEFDYDTFVVTRPRRVPKIEFAAS